PMPSPLSLHDALPISIGLVQFFSIWNDLLVALTFVTNNDLATIQVGLLNFSGEYGALQYGPLFAAISLNVFGTLIVFLFFSQKIDRKSTRLNSSHVSI